MTNAKENLVFINDKEMKESDMTDEQKYFARQIQDLRNKKARLQFELDQINASLQVFKNSLIESTKKNPKKF
tara:strand:+ start:1784 stop:1999 length:216 start_codon:yes stop_codon:yes gene_type:complete